MSIYYLIFAIGIFLVLRLLYRLLNTIVASKKIHRFIHRVFPLLEFTIWITFSLWVLNRLFSDTSFYLILMAAVIGSLVLIIGWYFLRDFVAGIILKTEILFEIKQRVKTPQAEGILRKTGYRSIEIETDQGELVKIPYSRLTTNAIYLQNKDESSLGHEVVLKVKSNIPIQEFKDNVINEILLLPWSSINKEPKVKVIEQNDEYNTFLINYYSISSRHASLIAQHLKQTFKNISDHNIEK